MSQSLEKDVPAGRGGDAVVIAVLAGLVAIVLSFVAISGAMAERFASALHGRMTGQVTVVVWGKGLESTDAAAGRAAELLAEQPGVGRAAILDPDASDAMVGRLLGGQALGVEQPRLISLSGPRGEAPSASSLERLLTGHGLTAALDDHRGSGGPLERQGSILAAVEIASSFLLCGVVFVVGFTRGYRAPGRANSAYDLMRRLGAEPWSIATLVARRSATWAFVGAVAGTLCADLLVFVAISEHVVWASLNPLGAFQVFPRDGFWSAACPVVLAGTAAVAGGLGAWRSIVQQERNL